MVRGKEGEEDRKGMFELLLGLLLLALLEEKDVFFCCFCCLFSFSFLFCLLFLARFLWQA